MDIALVHQGLIEDIHYNMLYMGNAPAHELGDVFDSLAEHFEALAICHLLEFADVKEFRVNLIRSGHSRRYFLQRSKLDGNDLDRHLSLTRTRAFFDALVAGDQSLAQDIANLSIKSWHPDWEYEEDFCYMHFCHLLLQPDGLHEQAAFHAILNQLEHALEGARSVRLDLCRSIFDKNRDDFVQALNALLEEEDKQNAEERTSAKVREGDLAYWPRSFVSIEGLALLKIAELVNMRIDDEFPRCPGLAELPWTVSNEMDLFEALERTS